MFGQLGSKVSDALQTEFFQWFHLEKTGEVAEGDFKTQTYQPTAEQFHDLVKVSLTADKSQTLKKVALAIKRSFIDSPQDSVLAADITKSFLGAALNMDDAGAMATAMAQIRGHQPASSHMQRITTAQGSAREDEIFEKVKQALDSGGQVYASMKTLEQEGQHLKASSVPQKTQPLPGEGEPAFLVYSGKRRQLEQKMSHGMLRMTNGPVDGAERLTITVSPA